MLRQDPGECLFSFICSSNNHISRIQGMIDRLCQTLGTPLCTLDDVAYHDFPPLPVLAGIQAHIIFYLTNAKIHIRKWDRTSGQF